MLSVSGILDKIRSLTQPNSEPYILYGDPAYRVSENILSPFRGQRLTPTEQEFNRAMSAVCVHLLNGLLVK